MRYKGSKAFTHRQSDRIGVLLVNLGTPDAPTPAALRRYLGEFLWDPRVVEIPRPLWWLILHGIILRLRPAKSAAIYAKVWREGGSPLLLETLAIGERLQDVMGEDLDLQVTVGMCYGNPSIAAALDQLLESGVRRLLVLPLYPQYSATTTGAAFDAVTRDLSARRWLPELRFVTHYHDTEDYIASCCQAIESHWQQHGRPEKLVLSFHGIPRRCLDNGDPYFCECHKTSRLIGEKLGLQEGELVTTFQSRFGKAEWLQPYTEQTLKQLAAAGTRHVHVFCPGFAVDCLETLEEIAMENRDYFLGAGGEQFHYIPALNARDSHITALANLITANTAGWETAPVSPRREALAKAAGAGE